MRHKPAQSGRKHRNSSKQKRQKGQTGPEKQGKDKPGRLILLNKPYGVLSQFSRQLNDRSTNPNQENRATLADYIDIPDFYPAGRLDRDSEGLLLLTDNGKLQAQISHPRYKLAKTYLLQVEGTITDDALRQLQNGVVLKDGPASALRAEALVQPDWLWPRNPPIRYRKNISDSWLKLSINEGRNRQVRRMTAAVGYPTLRLIRLQIGSWQLGKLRPGHWQFVDPL